MLGLAIILSGAAGYVWLPWLVPLPPSLQDHGEAAPPPPPRSPAGGAAEVGVVSVFEAGQTPFVPFDELPLALVAATVSSQDRTFWHHGGTDGGRIMRSLGATVAAGRAVSGGSTITEQLAKLASDRSAPRSVKTRLREALTARRIEMEWSKEKILAEYFARLPYGNGHIGVRAAAAGYFRKSPSELTVAESAFLAGLPDAPSRFDPYRHYEAARKRQEWVLNRMRAAGELTAAEADQAAREELKLRNP